MLSVKPYIPFTSYTDSWIRARLMESCSGGCIASVLRVLVREGELEQCWHEVLLSGSLTHAVAITHYRQPQGCTHRGWQAGVFGLFCRQEGMKQQFLSMGMC
jgi:hypothetical protein